MLRSQRDAVGRGGATSTSAAKYLPKHFCYLRRHLVRHVAHAAPACAPRDARQAAKVQLVLVASLLVFLLPRTSWLGACGASDKYCLNAASIFILINYKMANVAKLHVNGLPRCSLTQGGLHGYGCGTL